MMREILTNVLSAERLDAIFESAAQKQYTRELAFSSVVSLLTDVVTRSRPSPRKADQSRQEQWDVSAKAVYEKINRTEPATSATSATSAALVATTTSGMQQVIAALRTELPAILPGYRVKILDGNGRILLDVGRAERRVD